MKWFNNKMYEKFWGMPNKELYNYGTTKREKSAQGTLSYILLVSKHKYTIYGNATA